MPDATKAATVERKPVLEQRTLLVPLIVGGAILLQTLDAPLVATALPAISTSFHRDPLTVDVALTAYFVGAAMFLPASGWIADRFGARHVFLASIAIFALSSLVAGVSTDLAQLVGARILQGVAGGMLMPVGRLLLLRSVPKSGIVAAMSVMAVPMLMGPVLGPLLGGLIVTVASWRWVFLTNVPIAALGLWLVRRFIENVKAEAVEPLDLVGILLLGFGLGGLALGLGNLGRAEPGPAVVLALVAGGFFCLVAYAHHEGRTGGKVIDLSLFRHPTFFNATVGGFFTRLTIAATPYLLVILLQVCFEMSPLRSGLLICATTVGSLAMRSMATRIVRRFGFKRALVANGVLTAASLGLCAAFTQETSELLIVAVLLVHGFFRALQLTCVNSLPYAELPQAQMSSGTTVTGMIQQVAASLGIGACASLIGALHAARAAGSLSARDVAPVFVLLALASLPSLLFFLRLPAEAGAEAAGRSR